jgi:hypothetical protein
MSNYFLDTFKQEIESSEMSSEKLLSMMENTEFFLKVLRVKFESKDPELQKQGLDELLELKKILDHAKPK